MTLQAEYDFEISKDVKNVGRKIVGFFGDVERISPVASIETSGYIGGDFRDAWELIQTSMLSWTIYNPQDYASILAQGRQEHGGVWYGSEQWYEGIDPMIDKFEEELRV